LIADALPSSTVVDSSAGAGIPAGRAEFL